MNKKRDTSSLIANTIMAAIVIVSIVIMVLILLAIPFLLDFVGIQYTSKWGLVKFSVSIIIIDYCLEEMQNFIIRKIAKNKTKLLDLIGSAVNIIALTIITMVVSDVMSSVQFSFVGALLFATLLTLLTRIVELVFLKEEG